MWRLHRYYLKELLTNAGITFVVLFAIVVISMVARGIQRAQGGALVDAAIITLFWSLDAFPHLLPISFLVATVLTFARAAQDREITALRSAGISPRVPMMAAVLVGIVLSLIGSVGMHWLLPEVHFRKYRVVVEVVRNTLMNVGLAGSDDRVSIPGTDMTLTYGAREDRGGSGEDIVLRDCWLYLPDERADEWNLKSPILHVDKVWIPVPADGATALEIVLEDCRNPLGKERFARFAPSFPIRAIAEQTRRDEREEDIVSDQLLCEVMRGMHERPTAAIYTLHRRTCFALLPLLLGPIGYCLALLARDRGRAVAMLYALVPLLLFYAGDVLGAKLLRVTDRPEFGWLPGALLAALGTPFCWRELRR